MWSSSWLYNILDLINHSDLASKNVGGKSDQGDRTQVKEKFLKDFLISRAEVIKTTQFFGLILRFF